MLPRDQIRFSTLHNKRAEAIEEIYPNVDNLRETLTKFLNKYADKEMLKDTNDEAKKQFTILDTYVRQKDIYFNDKIIQHLNQISVASKYVGIAMLPHVMIYGSNLTDESPNDTRKKIKDVINDTIPALKKDLKIEFQKLLGIQKKWYD